MTSLPELDGTTWQNFVDRKDFSPKSLSIQSDKLKMVFPGGSVVKICLQCRRCRQEIQVSSLSQEDPLEEEMAIHSSILVWKIPIYGVAIESHMTGRLNNKQQQLSYHLLPGKHFRAIAHSFISCSAFTHAAKDRIWKNICDYDVKR